MVKMAPKGAGAGGRVGKVTPRWCRAEGCVDAAAPEGGDAEGFRHRGEQCVDDVPEGGYAQRGLRPVDVVVDGISEAVMRGPMGQAEQAELSARWRTKGQGSPPRGPEEEGCRAEPTPN